MPTGKVSVGSFLLLRPEDVGGWISLCDYVRVVACTDRITMTAPVVDSTSSSEDLYQKIYIVLAASRLVDASEVQGKRPGKLLRRAVAFQMPNGLGTEQVVETEERFVTVWYDGREEAVLADDALFIASPLVCILTASHQNVDKDWTIEELKERVLAVEKKIADAVTTAGTSTVDDLLSCLPGVTGVRDDTVVQWMAELRGTWNYTTVRHALRFAWVERGGAIAIGETANVADTIGADPSGRSTASAPPRGQPPAPTTPQADAGFGARCRRPVGGADLGNARGQPRGRPAARQSTLFDDDEDDDEVDDEPSGFGLLHGRWGNATEWARTRRDAHDAVNSSCWK